MNDRHSVPACPTPVGQFKGYAPNGLKSVSHCPRGIGVGQWDTVGATPHSTAVSGTAGGTVAGQRSLKALAQAILSVPPKRDNVGQPVGQGQNDCPTPEQPSETTFSASSLPDYAAFCPSYWRGCFDCPDFMLDHVRFCARHNLLAYGRPEVEIEVVP